MNKGILALVLVIVVLAVGFLLRQNAPEPDAEQSAAETSAAETAPTEAAQAEPATEEVTSEATTCPTPSNSGSGAHRAGLLVTYGNGTSQSVCVSFDETTITGYELLERSGLSIITEEFTGLGQALCKITGGSESDGCDYPTEECFCQSPPDSWVFFVSEGSPPQWTQSSSGISTTPVGDGGAQAQVWGSEGVTPPGCFYDDICL